MSHPLSPGKWPGEEMVVELECEALEQLEELVTRPSFLHALENAAGCAWHRGSSRKPQAQEAHPLALGAEQEQSMGSSGTWEHATAEDAKPAALPNPGDFELVEKEHAVEAMAYYIAQCLAQHPDAQVMSPQQLQDALSTALKSMKQSRFKRICTFGRHAYRWTTLSYSALQMYQNPWLVQAVVTALWTFSRLSMRVLLP